MEKLRIGIIGCGKMMRAHVQSMSEVEEVEITAFCDIIIEQAKDFAVNAYKNGFGVIIAAAGMAAHLAGAIAANTVLPVIGIPCKSSCFDGMDALLSTVQMPTGIPVATVAVNGGANAALLAAEIIAVGDEELYNKLLSKRKADGEAVLLKDAAISAELNK